VNYKKDKIKILYVCRLFNGLETSIKSKLWAPTGVPTIYRMIESLDRSKDYDFNLIITSKQRQSSWNKILAKKIKIKGLSTIVTVLPAPGKIFGRVGRYIYELFHILYILNKVILNRYDVLYVDHANIFSACVASRLNLVPVLFRVMGVYPMMRRAISHRSMSSSVLKWCYKSPFSSVVCTQDGSGIEMWLESAIDKSVPIYKLINGVEYLKPSVSIVKNIQDLYNIPYDKFIVLYIGKLEIIKGIYDFINGFLLANKKIRGKLHAIIIGHGDQFNNVTTLLNDNVNATSVTLIPRVRHDEIFNFYDISDLYISPNQLANLTNVNLEAMQSGACMAIPKSQLDTGVDLITDKLLNDDSVYRYDFPPTPDIISKTIINLYSDLQLRESLSKNIILQSNRFVTSWNERIELEMDILKKIV
jgi:glycosyltransferase involved in cell wall biosynthesis